MILFFFKVAASHDPNGFQYNIEIRLQPAKQEIIGDLTEIMKRQLRFFFNKTNMQPEKIIFYRYIILILLQIKYEFIIIYGN